jgi:hypothetical protein
MKKLLQIRRSVFHDWKVELTDSRAHLSPPVLFSGQKSRGRLRRYREDHVPSDLKWLCP